MDIHPVFVHFPIAFLTLYSFFELISFGKLKRFSSWFYIKLTLVLSGFLFILPTLQSGEIVKARVGRDAPLWEVAQAHENWAYITAFLFGILTLIYLLVWIKDYPECHQVYKRLQNGRYIGRACRFVFRLVGQIYHSPLVWVVALLGLVAAVVTGALGASMVHGPGADPVMSLVYRILGL